MERWQYIESEDRLVCETVYDVEDAMRDAEQSRQQGDVVIGSKGQQMLKAAVFPAEHILRVKQESGYDLLSPDPDQWRRALVYIQQNHQRFMATEKKVFSVHKPKWE